MVLGIIAAPIAVSRAKGKAALPYIVILRMLPFHPECGIERDGSTES